MQGGRGRKERTGEEVSFKEGKEGKNLLQTQTRENTKFESMYSIMRDIVASIIS